MATLYFNNGASDYTWNTLSNWWQDEAFTTPATAIPTTGDTVYLEATVNTGPTIAVSLAALYIAQLNTAVELTNVGAGISTTGDLTVGKSTYLSGYIFVNLTIGGTAYFYANSEHQGTLTVTLANFYKYTNNSGAISGSTVFNDYSANYSNIGGDATFNDSSFNEGPITGSATFNDTTNNYSSGTIGGNATFNDRSANSGTVSGNATVNYPVTRPIGGTISGSTNYYGYPYFYFNAAVSGSWNNSLNWWRDSGFSVPSGAIPSNGSTVYIEGNVDEGPATAVTLGALYVAQINSGVILGSSGAGISVTGSLIVGVEGSLYGSINNTAITIQPGSQASFYGTGGGNSGTLTVSLANFYDSTSNFGIAQGSTSNGIITGEAYFNGTSANYATVEGGAYFYNNSYNAAGGIIEGAAEFSGNSYNANGATVEGGAYFINDSYNASGAIVSGGATFESNSFNASGATVNGNVVFYDSSYNGGLVNGNATVYYPSPRPIGGTVTGTISYIGPYPPFYTLYFYAKTTDHTWDNLINWWTDTAFSVQAVAIPANGDTVYVESSVTSGPAAPVTLAALYVAQITNGAVLGSSGSGNITVTGNLTVGSGIFLYGRVDNANLTIGGTAYFYGGSGGNSSTLTVSTAYFYLGSSNYGTAQGSATNGVITGSAFFYNNASNFCSIGGNATFSDGSNNDSGANITGNVTFNDSSSNVGGATVGGNATFKNYSSNSGLVNGNASVYYPVIQPIGGTVTGTITYYNYP